MNRLQKKCLIASAGVHLLLAVILLVGPALAPRSKPDDTPVLDFVPVKTIDALMSGGGNPNAKPPQAAPPAPLPQPPPPTPVVQQPAPPVKTHEPEPVKEPVREVKPPKPDPESLEATDKPRKPEISTKLVTRTPDAKAAAEARAQAQAETDARRQFARAAGNLAQRIGSEMSGSTTVELKGPGGGGVPYANFLQAVKSAYMRALVTPDSLTGADVSTLASVTIARDGSVISARIVRPSGDADLDRAVQRTLDRVKYAAPLPDDAKEDQRTVEINFYPKAKTGSG